MDKNFNLASSNLVLLYSVGVIYETDKLTLHSIRVQLKLNLNAAL